MEPLRYANRRRHTSESPRRIQAAGVGHFKLTLSAPKRPLRQDGQGVAPPEAGLCHNGLIAEGPQ